MNCDTFRAVVLRQLTRTTSNGQMGQTNAYSVDGSDS